MSLESSEACSVNRTWNKAPKSKLKPAVERNHEIKGNLTIIPLSSSHISMSSKSCDQLRVLHPVSSSTMSRPAPIDTQSSNVAKRFGKKVTTRRVILPGLELSITDLIPAADDI
jgi:hypothetical protein